MSTENLTLVEAIKLAQETDQWFRPMHWSGVGVAFCCKDGLTNRVPSPTYRDLHMTPDIASLLSDWEVVKSSVVIDELESLKKAEA